MAFRAKIGLIGLLKQSIIVGVLHSLMEASRLAYIDIYWFIIVSKRFSSQDSQTLSAILN